ncbi:MAG: TPM domain-containing protein [Syntrophorhabdaceae bacterium]
MNKALNFFSHAEKERIREATLAAESNTIGEIAVMIVDASNHYYDAAILGAITFGNILAFLVTIFFLHESIWWYVPLTFVCFILFWFLFRRMPSLKMFFTGTKRKQLAVRDRALQAFYEKGLHRTKGNTGVLFFISILERKVWVLADKAIHEKIKQAKLDAFARMISYGIRNNDAAGALIKAIGEAGELLNQHFPAHAGDINELSDTIFTE